MLHHTKLCLPHSLPISLYYEKNVNFNLFYFVSDQPIDTELKWQLKSTIIKKMYEFVPLIMEYIHVWSNRRLFSLLN